MAFCRYVSAFHAKTEATSRILLLAAGTQCTGTDASEHSGNPTDTFPRIAKLPPASEIGGSDQTAAARQSALPCHTKLGGISAPSFSALLYRTPSVFEDAESEISDECLLTRLREGAAEALSELWNRYAGLMYTQALGVLHNPAEAEDVVIEVFSEVWKRASSYHPERARPVAWLVTLVRRRSIDRLRERRSYEKAGMRLAQENGEIGTPANFSREESCNHGVDDEVHLSELRQLLEQALDCLPEPQKETVRLVYFQGLTQKEIAVRTSTPLGTVKTRLELGLRKMRDRIKGSRMRSAMQVRAP